MPVFLLLVTVIIIACILLNHLSSRLGIPMLLGFILLGMFFGSDGVLKIPFDNYGSAEQICSVALIFIMFYGGFGTKWSEAKPAAAKAIFLSTAGVVMTAGITGAFCYFALRMRLLESLLIGAVISSTDAASVFSILRSKRLNLKDNTASLLEVESGSNDPFSYMLTMTVLSIMSGTAEAGGIAYMLFAQIVYGLLGGAVIAFLALWFLKNFHFATEGFDTIFVVAVVLLAYAAPAAIGGNGYLSAYVVGILLGNGPLKNKKALVHFFDGITGLMQMLIFFLLGLLAFPSQLPGVVLPALLIALFLTFAARPLAVFAIMTPFRCRLNQQLLVAWSGLRGAASIVFAIMAVVSPGAISMDIFHIVFFIVLFSILFQGSLIPLAARKLGMIDEHANVLKTFNDYTEEVPVQFIQFTIKEGHPWEGKAICDILLPPDTLLALLTRKEEQIVPKGDTVLLAGDVLVLSAKAMSAADGIRLTELPVSEDCGWAGKKVADVVLEPGKLIVMIRRQEKVIIPSGGTVLKERDVLVINGPTEE